MKLRGRWSWVVDFVLLLLLAAVLIRPYWKLKYTQNWGSIESTFIADARILKDHWPRPLWHPYWYVGTRFDYIYPPALRYGTAALAKFYPMDPSKAYHLYTGFFYCLGIAGVYLLARAGFRNRWLGIGAAVAAAVVSPAYLVLPDIAKDMFRNGPTRLNVLVRYGEGPHMSAFAMIPFALAFLWWAVLRRDVRWALAAGLAACLVVSNNFYGATALATFYPLAVWALWVTERRWSVLGMAAIPPLVAYGLSAHWLTPSYLEITLRNMQFVSSKGSLWSTAVGLVTMMAFLSITDRRYRGRPERAWELFLLGCGLFFTMNVVGNYWLNFRMIGEPLRLVPELDLIWILIALGVGAWLWRRSLPGKLAVALLLIGTFAVHWNYIRHHRAIFPLPDDAKGTLYYQVPQWIAANHPEARSYVTGAVRFWYNTWHDLHQLGGSSEQGLQNTTVMPSQWEIVMGPEAPLAVAWLQVMGVDLVAVHGPQSKEWYKDFSYPKKFEGVLKKVHEIEPDSQIYEVPRRYRSMARVVDRAALDALPKIKDQTDLEGLRKYVAVYEEGPEAPTETHWRGTDAMDVTAKTAAGQSLIVQTTYDPCWRVESNVGLLPTAADQLGFLRIDAPAGVEWVKLRFEKPLEKSVGEAIGAVTILLMGWTLWKQRARAGS